MKSLPAILANLALLVSAAGYGSLVPKLLPASFRQLDRLAVVLLAGIGVVGTLLFCVGQFWFSRWAIILVLVPGVILGLRNLWWEIGQLGGISLEKSQTIVPAIIVSAVLLMTAIAGLAEPTGDIRMDAIAYHLLGPKVWVRDGLIHPVLDECMTAFPAVVETQFAALMSLGGQRAPQFFAVVALVSMLLVTASLALRLGLDSSGTGWVLALIITMPVLYRGAYGGFVDVVYSGLVLAAVRIGFDAERRNHYLLFGLFCGLAMGTKYFGLMAWFILVLCIYYLAFLHGRSVQKTVLQNLGIASVAALIVASPWYLRNWIQLGSPIYPPTPQLAHLFSTRYLTAQAVQNFNDFFAKVQNGMGRGPISFLLLPFHLTFHPANFINGPGGIGLAPLALAPFGFIACRRSPFAQGLGLFVVLQTFAWFVTGQDPRYIIHVFVIAAALAVIGWKYVRQEAPKFGPVLSALVAQA